ncbi:acyltransferase [Wenzhouxiangella marina]|uniref:Acyltransferase n=1 Tax=Wenzhouxiangella marina TaxID=1579979 RepID=A0A0K0Y061_9GAMM|nr:acyltransferase [Wenzhouxiangella marina]AKS43256.1 acyltransferase [Wenzhouxiangella marina]MBB6087057.1 1-acyl-sn-glycerol-3-phosphate acyltransferase [Wenzhouxiangella marina]
MFSKLIAGLRVLTAASLLSLNTLVHVIPLLLVSLVKMVLRFDAVRGVCDRVLMAIAASWIDVNSWMFDHLTDTRIVVDGLPEPQLDGHFLVLCNHQSWVDIPVLQKLFNRRLPLLRFFLKSQLIWVPALGLAWWALDFPFMKRYTRAQIERRPELAGRDIEATRRACAKFQRIPVSVVNFVEGTRFTEAKHDRQDSPLEHLLKPRAGGTGFVLDAMGDSLDTLVDVTIVYPEGAGELGALFANRIPEIRVDVQVTPIPDELRGGDYQNDPEHRERVQAWINQLWADKDARIARLLSSST